MKIIISNKFYYYRGGDCVYCINLEKLLMKRGHEVAIFSMQHPENLENKYTNYFPNNVNFNSFGFNSKINAFLRIFGIYDVKKKFERLIKDFEPDVLHINNVHSYISPIIAKIAKENKIKTIWTLHDYKLICSSYSCLSENKQPCELCINGSDFNVLRKRCMKGNFVADVLGLMEKRYWNRNRIQSYVDYFICPSRFMAEKMYKGNFNSRKLKVLPNFYTNDIELSEIKKEREEYYIYIGRFSEEKGIRTLLQAASEINYNLKLGGTGPLFESLRNQYEANKNIEFLGHIDKDVVIEVLSKSKFSVIPSEWYENNPLSGIESLITGTPILGANIGGIPELISENNGELFTSGDKKELKTMIEKMFKNSYDYKKIADEAKMKFGENNYYEQLMNLYN